MAIHDVDELGTRPYKNYLLTVLMFVLAFNFVDRLALGLVLQNIKVDLHLSDTQLGLMSGIAFFFFYSVMGIPIARWADRGNRVRIIALCAALWSALVAACGLAGNFVQLLLIRTGVAIGEAGCVPTSFSLIADHFTRAERPRASARYTLGVPLSFFLGYFPAGWLNQTYGWRITFMVLGLPGILLATVALLTLKEPRMSRPTSRVPDANGTHASSPCGCNVSKSSQAHLKEVCTTLWKIPSFRHLLIGYSVLFFFINGTLQWQPTFFLRSYEIASGELGTWLAVTFGVGGFIGTYLGGRLASLYATHNESRQLKATSIVYVALTIISIAIYSSSGYQLAFVELAAFSVGMHSTTGPLWATIQTVVPERMRATAIAIIFLFANLIGTGCGPLAIGALSDSLAPWAGNESLRYALIIVSPGLLWAAWHLWRSSATVRQDIEATQRVDEIATGEAYSLCAQQS